MIDIRRIVLIGLFLFLYLFSAVAEQEKNFSFIDDLEPLIDDTDITSLWLNYCRFNDLSPLIQLINLESLTIASNPNLYDISPLIEMKNLKKLTITDCKNLIDITPIAKLENLEYLLLNNVEPFDGAILNQLNKLKELHILTPITSLQNVVNKLDLENITLNIKCNNMDIRLLNNLHQLKCIVLFTKEEQKLTIDGLEKLLRLEEIYLEGFYIEDLKPLINLPHLTIVGLNRSIIEVDVIEELFNSSSLKVIFGPGYIDGFDEGFDYKGKYFYQTIGDR